jgi:hypothetical protein
VGVGKEQDIEREREIDMYKRNHTNAPACPTSKKNQILPVRFKSSGTA